MPALEVAVVVPVSWAPAVPVPATNAAVTTVALSAVSVTPLLRTCTVTALRGGADA